MLRRFAWVAFGVVVFVCALAASVVIHLRLPVAQRAVIDESQRALAGVFAGEIRIDRVGRVDWDGVRDARARVIAPDGSCVIAVDHLDATLSPFHALRSALRDDEIAIDSVHVADASVSLDPTNGEPRIVRAFEPRTASTGPSAPSNVHVVIDRITIDHAWVHGAMDPWIDADVNDVRASLEASETGVSVDVDGAIVRARAMPRDANPVGLVRGTFAFRSNVVSTRVRFEGAVGGIGVRARGVLDGERFAARAEVADASTARLRAMFPEIPFDANVSSAFAEAEGRASAFDAMAFALVNGAHLVARARFDDGAIRMRAIADGVDAHAFVASIGRTNAHVDATFVHARDTDEIAAFVAQRGANALGVASFARDAVHASAIVAMSDANVLAPLGVYGVRGHGEARAALRVDRARDFIEGEGGGAFDDVGRDRVSLATVSLRASASGPMRDPKVSGALEAERIVVPGIAVRSARVALRGVLQDADVTARVAANGPFDVRAHIGLRGDEFSVRDLEVDADGKRIVRGELAWSPRATSAKLDARNVDLGELRRTLGVGVPLDGHASVALDGRIAGGVIDGRVVVDASRLAWGSRVRDLDAHVDASALANRWSLVSRARWGDIGWWSVEAMDVEPRGDPFDLESWKHATGSVHVDAEAALARLGDVVSMPRSSGDARIGVVVERRRSEDAPDVMLDASARSLVTQGLDASRATLTAHVDHTGHVTAKLDATLRDEHVTVDAATTLPWTAIAAGRFPTIGELASSRFTIDGSVPSRDASKLCAAFDFHCSGSFDATIHATGSFDAPNVRVAATFASFRSSASPFEGPIDGVLVGTLDRHHGDVTVSLRSSRDTSRTIDAHAVVVVPERVEDWFGSFDATAKDMPVRAPPQFTDRVASANVTGTIALHDFHRDARAKIDLAASDVRIEDVRDDRATISAAYDAQKLSLTARVQANDGNLDLAATTSAAWGAKLAPSIDRNGRVSVTLHAKNFRAKNFALLAPLEVGAFDGRLDADASANVALATSSVTLAGWIALADGMLRSPAIGDLHDIRGRLVMKPDGSLVLENARVRGTSGLATISGTARAPNGTIEDATLTVDIARNDAFPIAMSGIRLGTAWGHVEVNAKPNGNAFAIAVKVPKLHVVIPDSSYRDLEALGPPPSSIIIGVRDRGGVLDPVSLGLPAARARGPKWTIAIDLGNDVRVERGDMLSVLVTGRPRIELGGDKTRVTGRVVIVRGTLDIQGKRFQIDHGEATFTGDPSNPTLIVSATWDAPDGSRVFADYSGPVQNGKLTLRSEPAHTQDEIVSLLVFGSSDGPVASTGGNAATTTAVGAGASVATQPINKALSQLTHLDIKTRVDSGSASGSRSAIEVQLARDVSVQIAYVLGLPPPGTEPDRTWVTLMLHLAARWSLDFTMGDHGSSIVEALWHYRY